MRTPTLVYRSAVIAALGGFLFGFDTAVISGTVADLKSVFRWKRCRKIGDCVRASVIALCSPTDIMGRLLSLPDTR